MKRKRRLAALFDLDGVVLDTEGQYDRFWMEQGKRYHPEIPDFHKQIKGFTIEKILEDHFGGKEDLQQQILRELDDFESLMDYAYVPGVEKFIRLLLSHGVKTALVTSSNNVKLSYAVKAHPEFTELFERMITGDKVSRSKPDPECYLLASTQLQIEPEICCVFEDSFAGIEAGRNAGMKVVGVATTNPVEKIQGMVDWVVSDFTGCMYVDFEDLMDRTDNNLK